MCGIYCLICPDDGLSNSVSDVKEGLRRRGPDCLNEHHIRLTSRHLARVVGSVLHLKGANLVQQPIVCKDGSFLLWNGEIFGGLQIPDDTNDTLALSKILQGCREPREIVNAITKIQGPWAFIYWQAGLQKLWFGRDVFGRRSLLWRFASQFFVLTSVASRPQMDESLLYNNLSDQNWAEVDADGIYCLDLSNEAPSSYTESIRVFPWYLSSGNPVSRLLNSERSSTTSTVPTTGQSEVESSSDHSEVEDLSCRVTDKLKVISKGLNTNLPQPSDLQVYDKALNVLRDQSVSQKTDSESLLSSLLDGEFLKTVSDFEKILQESVCKRVNNQPHLCKNCVLHRKVNCSEQNPVFNGPLPPCSHAKVAVLFSGGLDSTVLCLLADRCIDMEEPIDLLNVAFENHANKDVFQVPDRISGKEALDELKSLSPQRKWNFVNINVTKEEMRKAREKYIADLVYPLETVLDNDIGCAVWFASRGCGIRKSELGFDEDYVSPARIVLTGIGADEQLAGYARHRVCFLQNKWKGLIDELKMEMNRISSRNLGRDDRVIADHGREGRFPFLDENVVSYLNDLPIWLKANLNLSKGVGDKLLLRCLAYKLGLRKTAMLVKRAIQFGSRIAKMEGHHKGTDICLKLKIRTQS